MPIYDYLCVDCGEDGQIVAGIDDHLAVCVNCGRIMMRLDDSFAPKSSNPCSWCQAEKGEVSGPGVSHGICESHAAEFMREDG